MCSVAGRAGACRGLCKPQGQEFESCWFQRHRTKSDLCSDLPAREEIPSSRQKSIMSSRHISSGIAVGERTEGKRQETDSSGDIWHCNKRCESTQVRRPGQGNISPMGPAGPRTGLLMRSDNPHRVQL